MKTMRLQIISPRKVIFDGECTMLEYNTTEGYVGVFPGHVAMTQVIAPGKFCVYEENKEEPLVGVIHSGIVKIMPDLVTILAELCELKSEIDLERAKLAKERAEKRLAERNDENFDYERAVFALNRANARISVVTE